MQPSWSIPIPQAMQQHGGSAKSQAVAPAPTQAGQGQEVTVRAGEAVSTRANEPQPHD
jgi:hypothetical protein